MSYKESDIAFESPCGTYFVLPARKTKDGRHGGFDVYKSGTTHAVRVAQIGFGEAGLIRAKAEIERRLSANS